MAPTISLYVGNVRRLTDMERKRYPKFKYVLSNDCICVIDGKKIVIPKGFLTDGSSGGPDMGWSWVIHDYLYSTHKFHDGTPCTQKEADMIMYHILKFERHHAYANLFVIVKMLGRCFFNRSWRKNYKRGPVFLQQRHKTYY